MRIGIDCRTILNPGFGEHAGIGHYTYYLVKNLLEIDKENEYVLFFDRLVSKEAAEKLAGGRKNVKIRFFPFHVYKHYLPFVYSHLLVSAFISKEKLDLFHSPANALPLTYPGKSVVTVHDLAIYKHPEWFPSEFLSGQSFSTKILIPKSLKKAKKIIAVSKSTKNDIKEIFKIPERKIAVVYEGVEAREFPPEDEEICGVQNKLCKVDLKTKYGLKDNYILYLGTIEPRKNVVGLVKAFCKLLRQEKDFEKKYQLVIAGAKGWKSENVFKEIKKCAMRLKSKETIKYLGYIPASDKFSLMAHATCFVFPSLYEGFGLPVLEALSLGVPTVTSNVSSIPEITGKNAAILINPNKSKELSDAILEILKNDDLRNRLKEAVKKQAKKFSWEKCAKETLEVYLSI